MKKSEMGAMVQDILSEAKLPRKGDTIIDSNGDRGEIHSVSMGYAYVKFAWTHRHSFTPVAIRHLEPKGVNVWKELDEAKDETDVQSKKPKPSDWRHGRANWEWRVHSKGSYWQSGKDWGARALSGEVDYFPDKNAAIQFADHTHKPKDARDLYIQGKFKGEIAEAGDKLRSSYKGSSGSKNYGTSKAQNRSNYRPTAPNAAAISGKTASAAQQAPKPKPIKEAGPADTIRSGDYVADLKNKLVGKVMRVSPPSVFVDMGHGRRDEFFMGLLKKTIKKYKGRSIWREL